MRFIFVSIFTSALWSGWLVTAFCFHSHLIFEYCCPRKRTNCQVFTRAFTLTAALLLAPKLNMTLPRDWRETGQSAVRLLSEFISADRRFQANKQKQKSWVSNSAAPSPLERSLIGKIWTGNLKTFTRLSAAEAIYYSIYTDLCICLCYSVWNNDFFHHLIWERAKDWEMLQRTPWACGDEEHGGQQFTAGVFNLF